MQLIHDAIASDRPRNHNDTKYLWKMLLRVHYRTKRGNEVHSIALSKLGYLNDGSCAGVVPHAIDMLVCWYVGIGLLVCWYWYGGMLVSCNYLVEHRREFVISLFVVCCLLLLLIRPEMKEYSTGVHDVAKLTQPSSTLLMTGTTSYPLFWYLLWIWWWCNLLM